jgi:hypothetical protein
LTHEILDRREGEILPPGSAEVDVAAIAAARTAARPNIAKFPVFLMAVLLKLRIL